jgi:hypothetical protein
LVADLASAIAWTDSCPDLALSDRAIETLTAFKTEKEELRLAGLAADRQRDKEMAAHRDACQLMCTSSEWRTPKCRFLTQK